MCITTGRDIFITVLNETIISKRGYIPPRCLSALFGRYTVRDNAAKFSKYIVQL